VARPLFAQVNLAALRANLARARVAAPGAKILAVVKADAYGHGLTRVLPALDDADGLSAGRARRRLDAPSTCTRGASC
jgi:alanine racemase